MRFACSTCGCQYRNGEWAWSPAATRVASRVTCPACKRVEHRFAAATLRLRGPFGPRRDEVLALVRAEADAERTERPLERLIEVLDTPDGMLITTTGMHVARRIADALVGALRCAIRAHYLPGGGELRVDLVL